MTEVMITKRQAKFIESFGSNTKKAMYYIARTGWGYAPTDGHGNVDDNESPEGWTFEVDEKEKMVQALLNGYIIEPEKPKEVVMYMCFEDDNHNTKKVYYGSFYNVSSKERATFFEEDSFEIDELKAKGWEKEEV